MTAIVKYLVFPSNLIFLSAVAGIGLLCCRATRKFGKSFMALALVLYLVFGTGPVAFWLLGQLEYQVAPVVPEARDGVSTLVVLAAYAEPDPDVPVSSRVSDAAAIRLLEVLSQYSRNPNLKIIISGAGGVPEIMRDVLIAAGVPDGHILIDVDSLHTFESAKHVFSLLQKEPFLLVTSAGHMPRAMGVFRKIGGNPRPIPTHYLTRRNWLAIQYLPKPSHLEYSDLAMSEYAALVWYRVNGWL